MDLSKNISRMSSLQLGSRNSSRKCRQPYNETEKEGFFSVLYLPFDPIWYYFMMISSAIENMIVLLEACPNRDYLFYDRMMVFIWSVYILYLIDVILIVLVKIFPRKVGVPEIHPSLRPVWIITLECLSLLPTEICLGLFMDEDLSKQYFGVARLIKILKAPRVLYYFYYQHRMLESSVAIKLNMLVYCVGIYTVFSYAFSYHLLCLFEDCDLSSEFEAYYIIVIFGAMTNHGFAVALDIYLYQIILCFLSYLGIMLIAFNFAFLVNDLSHSQLHRHTFSNNLQLVVAFLKSQNVSKDVINVCREFYVTFWKERKGYSDNMDYTSIIPYPMYQEVVLDIYWAAMKHSTLFRNVDLYFSRYISTFMCCKFMLEGEVIYQKNELKTKMIYVSSGVIQIISEQDGETPILSFSCGTLLGESSLLLSYNSGNTVRCQTYCEIIELRRRDFVRAVQKYPRAFQDLRRTIELRYEYAKHFNDISNYFGNDREGFEIKNATITWLKNTLHSLMAQDETRKRKHEHQNIYVQYEMKNMSTQFLLFCARYLDMLVVTERVELHADAIFMRQSFPYILQAESVFQTFWEGIVIITCLYAMFQIPYCCLNYANVVDVDVGVGFFTINVMWIVDFCVKISTVVKTKDRVIKTVKGIVLQHMNCPTFYADFIAVIPMVLFSALLVTNLSAQTTALLQINKLLKVYRVFVLFNAWENKLHVNLIVLSYVKYTFLLSYGVFLAAIFLFGVNCSLYDDCDYNHGYSVEFSAIQIVSGIGLVSLWERAHHFNLVYFAASAAGFLLFFMMSVRISVAYILESSTRLKTQKMTSDLDYIVKKGSLPEIHSVRIRSYIKAQWLNNHTRKLLMKYPFTSAMPLHLFQVMREAAFAHILRKNKKWLDGKFNVPRTSYRPGRPSKTFSGSSSRSKRRKTEELRKNTNLDVLTFATQTKLAEKGKRDASSVLKNLTSTPTRAKKYKRPFSRLNEKSASQITPLDAVSMFVEAGLSRKQYEIDFFSNLDEGIIIDICTCLIQTVLPPQEIVCYAEDACTHIYILTDGFCYIGNLNKVVSPGYTIGILEAFYGLPASKTVLCKTYCQFLVMEYTQMKRIYAKYPEYNDELKRVLRQTKVLASKASKLPNDSIQFDIWKDKTIIFGSFFEFPKYVETNSFMEYEYHIPFDKCFLFGWTKHLLMRRTIIPDGAFIFYWEISRCIFAVLTAILATSRITGACGFSECSYAYILVALDVTAIIDIYVRFHICYYDKNGILVLHPLKTSQNYLTHGFCIDVISIFPFKLFLRTDSAEEVKIFLAFQSCKLLQLHRFLQMKYIMKFDALVPNSKTSVWIYVPMILVLSCIFGSYIVTSGCSFHSSIPASENYTEGVSCAADSLWEMTDFSKPLSPQQIQFYSIYIATSVLTTIGTQGFVMDSRRIGMIVSVLSFVGVYLAVHIGAEIISLYSSSSPAILAYQQNMKLLMLFMNNTKVSKDIQSQIIQHYELKWRREKGRNVIMLIKRFHKALKQDVLFELFGRDLAKYIIFPVINRALYKELIFNSYHTTIFSGGRIVSINDITDTTYILFKGYVDVLGSGGEVINTISVGAMFGNVYGTQYTRMNVQFIARSHVEILSLPALKFMEILRTHSDSNFLFRASLAHHKFYVPGDKFEKIDEGDVNSRWVLLPTNRVVIFMELITLSISCYITVCLDTYMWATEMVDLSYAIAQYCFDACYLLYIFVKYHTSYENELGYSVMNLKKVQLYHINSSKYRWKFYVDLISCIPFDVTYWFVPNRNECKYLYKVLRINRLPRLINVYDFFTRRRNLLSTNHTAIEMLYIFFWTTLFLHMVTCALMLCICQIPHNLIDEIECHWDDHIQKALTYVTFLHWMIDMFTKTATNQHMPDNGIVALILTLVMIMQFLTAAVFHSHVFLLIYKNYFTRIKYTNKWYQLKNFMAREEVSTVLSEKVHKYIQRIWLKNKGVLTPKLLEYAPNYLKEAVMESAYSNDVKHHPVISRFPIDIRRQIISKLGQNLYFPGDYIAFTGDINETTYFIKSGSIIILRMDDDLYEEPIRTLYKGDVFCITNGLTKGIPNNYSYKALELSTLLSLSFTTWEYLLAFYPTCQTMIDNYMADDPQSCISVNNPSPRKSTTVLERLNSWSESSARIGRSFSPGKARKSDSDGIF